MDRRFPGYLFGEVGIEIMTPRPGGAEPDESWCLGEDKRWPNLVLEIALTSGGLKDLEICRRFNVPEVWIWRTGKLAICLLNRDGARYDPATPCKLLPDLDIAVLESCAGISSWQQAR